MMKSMRVALAVVLGFGLQSNGWAIGAAFIGNEVPSARAAGAGYVGVAGQNEDPTAVFTNPGAMTSLLGTQTTLGLTWENIHGGYKDNAGAETKERVVNVAVPNFAMTQSFMDGKLSAGLSSQSPFGLETHWNDNTPMRYVATNSVLHMVDIMPAIAYQIHPKVSVGVGADYINLFDAQLDRQVNVAGVNAVVFHDLSGGADATSSLRGQATTWGYHAGVVIQPTEQHAIGITYHSQENLRVNGNVTINGMSGAMASPFGFGASNYTTSAYTDIVLPSNLQLGYAYKPTDKWLFEADAAWYHWSVSKDVNIRYAETNPTRLALLNAGNPEPLNLHDAWSANAGVNYKMSDQWQLRGGLWYEPWVLPESAFTPAFMDLSRYGISTGFGYAFTKSITLDAAYSAVFFHNRTINNSFGVNGTYQDFANLVTLNVSYRFGAAK